MAECLFCRIVRREIPAQIVHEDDEALVFKDVNPQAPTHVLVVPKKHIGALSATTDADVELLGRLQRTACRVASEAGLSSFRLVTNDGREAGQSVAHLHYHLLGGRPMSWPPG
ncbi:MAG TPA: histidine triad nucleotide-binding protein [Elusimicrobiota bacterium]|jgi:histidine triad (HIT) family protein|nr:histidine triad nucleotide-binding protein [Elusimicrobiota bacterium]